MQRTLLALSVFAPVLVIAACGGSEPGSTEGSGAAGTGGSATGGAATGGSTSMASSSSSSGTGGTGGGMMGACTNAADMTVLGMIDVEMVVGDCAEMNFGMEPGTKDCITMQTGLSEPCVTCFDNIVQCSVSMCFAECAFSPDSQACIDCRNRKCTPAFVMCSGLDGG